MNILLSKRSAIDLIILVIALSLGIYLESRPRIAPGQKPLTDVQKPVYRTIHFHWRSHPYLLAFVESH